MKVAAEQINVDNEERNEQETSPAALAVSKDAGPGCWLITHSVAKRHNVGTLLRCATAFGVREVCLVGSRQFNSFGSHGSDAYVDLRHFDTLRDCCQRLKEEQGCQIVGIEITDDARPVQEHPFTGPTAFMLGNEGQGLSAAQLRLCDAFVYIPQHGAGTASLNVAVAASIVLHHYALWAAYPEREREGQKFVVAARPSQRKCPRGVVRGDGEGGSDEQVRELREQRRQAGRSDEADLLGKEFTAALFDEDEQADEQEDDAGPDALGEEDEEEED